MIKIKRIANILQTIDWQYEIMIRNFYSSNGAEELFVSSD